MKAIHFTALLLAPLVPVQAGEIHVTTTGNDANAGTKDAPLRKIQHAAELAQPGDTITVHPGVYRERVNPPRGGESDSKRIVYQAAPGEKVVITGSEIVKNWTKVQDDVWKVTIPNTFFGNFNPYSDLIRGDWFDAKKREHHTGAVYLNGEWLTEAAKLDDVMKPVGTNALWFGKVEGEATTIWAQFQVVNPNEQLVEINVRQTVFYPDKPGRNFITVRGFTMRHAATPWAPPTAEQIGLIGTHWSKGWIIESNIISHSTCSGIALGKHGDKFDNTSADTAEGYAKTIERAQAHAIPWTKEHIGHHIVRNNHISHCEQTGIVGSMGCAFSTVTGNVIHDIHVRQLFTGAEMAGIKFHGAIDATIGQNHIYRTCRGLWLDWMAQGARVTGNLFHDNSVEDVYMEVNHGPYLVDNNIFLSTQALRDLSEGGAYVHNLFAGTILSAQEPGRQTPYHPAHATVVAGLVNITGGDNRFYNNLFIGGDQPVAKDRMSGGKRKGVNGYGLWEYDDREFPLHTGGNVYLRGARSYAKEVSPFVLADFDPKISLVDQSLHLTLEQTLQKAKADLVRTKLLGKAKIPNLPYENADGTPLKVDTDYFGKKRSEANPTPGPFENPGTGLLTLKVWQSKEQ
jgi:alpha-N-arabinofuranosidase